LACHQGIPLYPSSFHFNWFSCPACFGKKYPDFLLFGIPEFMLLCLMQGWLRAIWRFLYFVFSTLWSIVALTFYFLTGMDKKKAGHRVRRQWLNHIPRAMGLQLKVIGTPAQQPCLFVGNHISYVDPICVLMYVDANVVAKAEVKRWPLVGYGAHLVGTLFVKREEKSSRHETALAIQTALQNKDSILVYPEGTTTAGPGTLPFKPRSFDAAQLAAVPVQPIAIIYDSSAVAFIGKDTFLPHFFRMFRMKKITGRIAFGPLLYGENTAAQAEEWINRTQASDQPSTQINGHQ
jgi:1-acyl-sn-glycerol-3-phosphate acyltransferase